MKKVIVLLFIVSLCLLFKSEDNDIIIPGNAIRFRVIANSNSINDQAEKMIIKSNVEKEIYSLINNIDSSIEVSHVIKNNMDEIENIVKSYNIPYSINFGLNYFPTKNYKGILYEAGDYESLVITLGEGLGNNFWCVLFPPLCLLDNENEDIGDVEYQLYVKKILDRF